MRAIVAVGCVLVAWTATSPAAFAQADFPSRPITIVIGLSAGGITDITTRMYAEVVSGRLGQRLIVDNRPSGGGAVAASNVQRAAADGYTLLAFSGAQHAALPAMQSVPYDQVKGFQPVTTLFALLNFLVVPKDSPVTSVRELLDRGRSKPKGLLFGSSGVGSPSHLTAARLALSTNTPIEAVQYRGAAAMIPDLVAGRLDFALVSYTVARSYFSDGKLKLLAIDSNERWPDLPDVPTLREAGVDQPRVANWFGLAAPADTPLPIVGRFTTHFRWRRETWNSSSDYALTAPLQ